MCSAELERLVVTPNLLVGYTSPDVIEESVIQSIPGSYSACWLVREHLLPKEKSNGTTVY